MTQGLLGGALALAVASRKDSRAAAGIGFAAALVADADVFIGSNSALVAPVRIGRGANVTAGSVITEDVPGGAVAFGRARQVTKQGRAAPLRAKLRARAAVKKAGATRAKK